MTASELPMTTPDLRNPALEVKDLTVRLRTKSGLLEALRRVTFDVGAGEAVGLVGESGCGKSLTALAIAGLLPPRSDVEGTVSVAGRRLDELSGRNRRAFGGKHIGMVFQDPVASLNPVLTIGDQISEVARHHLGVSRGEARRLASDMLARVGIPPSRGILREYPHQLSGGMCQRVMLAIALICGPQLVIADEPTTALDVTIQAQMLELLGNATLTSGASLLLISHDLGVVARTCDRVLVMYAGQIVESGPTSKIVRDPNHPYTSALIASVPDPKSAAARLRTIPGTVPQLNEMPDGCRFKPRCPNAQPDCEVDPPLGANYSGGLLKCWHPVGSETLDGGKGTEGARNG
jgi:peptide/nickel transport system ATP-binding protein